MLSLLAPSALSRLYLEPRVAKHERAQPRVRVRLLATLAAAATAAAAARRAAAGRHCGGGVLVARAAVSYFLVVKRPDPDVTHHS